MAGPVYSNKRQYGLNVFTGRLDLTDMTRIEFLNLRDTPDTYTGQATRVVAVNATEDGLEFVASAGAPTNATFVTMSASGSLTAERVLTAGAGIAIVDGGANNPVTVSSTITQYTDEMVDDRVSNLLVAGNNIDLTYNDPAGTLTIDVEALSSADISDFNEAVDDRVDALLVNGAGISLSYDDIANTLTITNTGVVAEADTLDSVTGRGSTTTNAITVGNIQSGAAGADGKLTLYSEQGLNDYTVTLNPNATMTNNLDIYLPAAPPAATYLLTMSAAGVVAYDASDYITAGEVSANETDPVYSAWIAGPPNVSEFTNDSGYITAWGPEADPVYAAWIAGPPNVSEFTNDAGYLTGESDTLNDVTGRGNTTTNSITAGNIQSGAAGADGKITLYSEQGLNDYTVSLNPNSAMSNNLDIYLPAAPPIGTYLLTMSAAGVIEYDANDYITAGEVPANETDPVYSAWYAGPPNVSEFTNDAGYITAGDVPTNEDDPHFYAAVDATNHYTGFPNRTDTSLSWNDGTYTLTLTAAADSIWIDGVEYSINSLQKQITDATDFYWFWITAPGGVPQLNMQNSQPGFEKCLVATVYWNTTTDLGLLSEERHWMGRDQWTHEYLHETIGARYASGLGGTFTDTDFSIDSGEIYDEDIEIVTLAPETTAYVLYHNGSAAWEWDELTTPYKVVDPIGPPPDTNLRYNSGNNLATIAANRYVNNWVFMTNNTTHPIMIIIGQAEHTTIAAARAEAVPSFGSLPSAESKLIYRVTYRNVGGVPDYIETTDYRTSSNLPITSYVATDHGSLTGLSDDDHTIYAHINGRSGGQTIKGGTDANDDLTLHTTSNGTKGTYYLTDLTDNGFVKTSGGTGALSVDTSVYLTSESDTLDSVTGRGSTTTNSITVGNIQSGAAGADGKLTLYSEQGLNDYTVTLNPHSAMSSNLDIYLPSAAPGGTYLLTMSAAGVIDYDSNDYITAGEVTANETDPVYAAWYAGPPNVSEFTNDAAYITGADVPANEADTLDTVTGRGATTSNAITVGDIQSGAAGADGKLTLYSEQGVNDYTVSLNPNSAMTANADFYLPAALPGGTYLLTVSAAGVMAYDSNDYITAAEVTANETDPVYAAWYAGPPNVSEFTNDIGYLTAENDTLDDVCERGATTDVSVIITGNLDLGADDDSSTLTIHDAGTIVMYDDSDNTTVTIGPVADGKTTLGITGDMQISGHIGLGGSSMDATEVLDITITDSDDYGIHVTGTGLSLDPYYGMCVVIDSVDASGGASISSYGASFTNQNDRNMGLNTDSITSKAYGVNSVVLNNGDINSHVTGNYQIAYGYYADADYAGEDTSTAALCLNYSRVYGGYFDANSTVTVNNSGGHNAMSCGVYGTAASTPTLTAGTLTMNTYGGYFTATGTGTGASIAYGVYATATGADTNWAGYFSGAIYGDSTLLAVTSVTSGALYSYGNIYINSDGADGDSYLYFYEGGGSTGASLMWDDSDSHFDLSHALVVTGNLNTTGESLGDRQTLLGGNSRTNISTGYLYCAAGTLMTATIGYVMPRAGSIVGISGSFNVSSHAINGNVVLEVYKAGGSVYTLTTAVAGNADYKNSGTQARGTDTFAANDVISFYVTKSGTYNLNTIVMLVEIVFDT